MEEDSKKPMLSNEIYDAIKWVVMVLIPALSSAYFALGALLGLPQTETVVGVLAIVATFLSTILGLSGVSYRSSGAAYDGYFELQVDPGGVKSVALNTDTPDPEDLLMEKDVVTFKVKRFQAQ